MYQNNKTCVSVKHSYIALDAGAWTRHKLTPHCRVVYLHLLRLADWETKSCRVSRHALADALGIGLTTVKKAIKTLEAVGAISKEAGADPEGDPAINEYTVLEGYSAPGQPFVAISKVYWDRYCARLTPPVMAVLITLLTRANRHTRKCWPSINLIARESGVSRRTAIRAIHTLAAEGIIYSQPRRAEEVQCSNLYTILKGFPMPENKITDDSDWDETPEGVGRQLHGGGAPVTRGWGASDTGVGRQLHPNQNILNQNKENQNKLSRGGQAAPATTCAGGRLTPLAEEASGNQPAGQVPVQSPPAKQAPAYQDDDEESPAKPAPATHGFFLEDKTPPAKTPGRLLAEQLYEGLQRHRKIMRRPHLPTWAKQMDALLAEGHRTVEEVRATLDWYLEHIGEQYVPQAYSPEGFWKKYLAIEQAAGRGRVDNGGASMDARIENFKKFLEKKKKGEVQ